MRRILGNKSLHCDHCEFETRSKTLLTRHIEQHHSEKVDSQDEKRKISRINCTLCSFKTTSKYVLKRHIEVHHKEGTIACAVCKEKLQTNGDLKKHMKDKHTELSLTQSGKQSSRIACDVCGQRFNKRTTFNTHIEKMHGGFNNNNFNTGKTNCEVPHRSSGDKKKESASVSTSDQDH